jgi:two-component system NtrC family sensor kinase
MYSLALGARGLGVNIALPAPNERIDLEKKFVLASFALLATGCVTYSMLEARQVSMLLKVVLIGLVGSIAAGIAHYTLFRPIRRLIVMAKAVGAGDFSKRLRFRRNDEIGSIAHEMDTMCDQLEVASAASEAHIAALEQLRHSDRVATLGRLASSVAHELGNPLNVIELRAQLISSGDVTTLHQAQQNAAVIVEQTKRMTRIIGEILSFARMQPAKLARLDVIGVLRKGIALSEHTSRKHKTSIVLNVPGTAIEVDGDADKLLQVIVNLVVNGVQAMPGGGTLTVSTRDESRAPIDDPDGLHRQYVCIDVTDRGIGIPEELISKVFEPFVSTKVAEGGTGLGLSVAQGIAREHEGWISVASELGFGSVFKVHLPKYGLKGVHANGS